MGGLTFFRMRASTTVSSFASPFVAYPFFDEQAQSFSRPGDQGSCKKKVEDTLFICCVTKLFSNPIEAFGLKYDHSIRYNLIFAEFLVSKRA